MIVLGFYISMFFSRRRGTTRPHTLQMFPRAYVLVPWNSLLEHVSLIHRIIRKLSKWGCPRCMSPCIGCNNNILAHIPTRYLFHMLLLLIVCDLWPWFFYLEGESLAWSQVWKEMFVNHSLIIVSHFGEMFVIFIVH